MVSTEEIASPTYCTRGNRSARLSYVLIKWSVWPDFNWRFLAPHASGIRQATLQTGKMVGD